ncbi:MAG: hypothetical protein RBR35_10660, partial [Salinivirgaceae bacterium]|nr:hypothetical protein [Salinivirgaceae bacterium]
VFIGLIAFPFVNQKLTLVKDIENTENRQAVAKPDFDIHHLDAYPSNFDKYYSDNFSIRQILIKQFNQLNLVVFKKSPLPDKVVIGKENWIFMGDNEVDSYQGKHRLNTHEMESMRIELEYRKQYLESKGCKFYFLIAPVKANIYPEFMPMNLFRFNKQSWGEQLIEYLNTNSEVKPIDIYDPLRQNKRHGLMYHKLDNHWNKKGAFFAAQEVLNSIGKDISNVGTLSYSDYIIVDSISRKGNLTSMLSNTELFTDSIFEITPKDGFKSADHKKVGYPVISGFPYPWEYEFVREIPNSNKPKILIISDSYGANIFPYIAEGFSRSVKIFDSWQYKLNEDIVKSENPDVFLLIVLESNIRNLLNFQSNPNKSQVK